MSATYRKFPLIFLLVLLSGVGACSDAAQRDPWEHVIIGSASGRHVFSIELARTDQERSFGLMYRTELAPDHGMLFDFKTPENVSMWMRNTLIPLDMLFIDRTGGVVFIEKMTEPGSLRSISAGQPVLAVLELAGGTADRLGLAVGDRVEHPIFRRRASGP